MTTRSTTTTTAPGLAPAWRRGAIALAVMVYVPLLLTAPGQVVADTKTYLYLDPGRLLGRAVSMWDPHVGLGTVPHQQIGYLWPAGPWYWLMEQLAIPDWTAQRLWLGSILVAAGTGVLYLARTWRWKPSAGIAAAFAYALSPFVLTLAARISLLLLPFAALPWLLAFTVRALHTRGWRYPALFGLTVATAGSVNATSILLVGIVPVLWIIYVVVVAGEVGRPRAITTAAKIGAITLFVNVWWIIGLSVQATNGIDILRYTETAQVVADSSSSNEVLRGLGYWFFYGGDRLGPWIESSVDYTQRLSLIALTYLLPSIALLALGIVRWRHRSFLVAMVLVGTLVAVGAHPWNGPSPFGILVRAFITTDVGLAMRSLPRAVPIVALGLALGLGSLVGAAEEQDRRRGMLACLAVMAVTYAALPPLWLRQFVPDNLRRDEVIPSYWTDAIAHLDAAGEDTRILELPGTDFASYRWGNTVDPITPGLTDRPYVARELIPYGSPASADLLNALDRRYQEATMSSRGLAAVARLMGVGEVVLRNDLQYERYNTPRPRTMLDQLARSDGLGEPVEFGVGVPNEAGPEAPLLDETHLAGDGGLPASPAVVVFPVEDARPIVRVTPVDRVVLLAGDGDGVVDAAMAGLLLGDELIRYSAELTDDVDFPRTGLTGAEGLVVTDTNRRRAERWTTVRHTQGFTEELDGGILRLDRTDNRLTPFADRPGTQAVAEHGPVSVRATDYGNPITYTPEERPVNATDGDPTTSWRVAAFGDAVGHRIELTLAEPATEDHVIVLQPQTGEINRWITDVRLRFDDGEAIDVALDETSRTLPGQRIAFDERTFDAVSIEILADTAGRRPGYSGLTSVGFAEITVAGRHSAEVIRMPSDLLDAGGFRTLGHPLALVQTRQRSSTTEVTRTDEEFAMARVLDLPVERTYALSGTARLSARAPTEMLDRLLGRRGLAEDRPIVTASSTLPGGLAHLPSNAADADRATWWTSAFGAPAGQSLTFELPTAAVVDALDLVLVDDAEHSLPTTVTVTLDGVTSAPITLETTPAGPGLVGASITLPEAPAASEITVSFPEVETRSTISWHTNRPLALPIAVAEIGLADDLGSALRVAPLGLGLDTGCRDDLVRAGGKAVPVRIRGTIADALAGRPLAVRDCSPGTTLGTGDTSFRTTEGRRTGLDLDQLVWRSAPGGAAFALDDAAVVRVSRASAPEVSIVRTDDATVEATISEARRDEPFWLVLGQSHNTGWSLETTGGTVEGPLLVDGYANGFLVTPSTTDFDVRLRFVPQNRVEVGLLVSMIGVAAAFALVLLPSRPLRPLPIPLQEPLRSIRALTWEGALPRRRDAQLLGLGAGLVAAVLATPAVGVAVGLIAGFSTRREGWRWLTSTLPAMLLALVGIYVVGLQFRNGIGPGLHWPTDTGRLHAVGLAAVILLGVDVAIDRMWAHRSDFR